MKKFDEINIIPFIDIMLVLLAIVLVTASFLPQGKIQVKIPDSSSEIQLTSAELAKLLTLNKQGEIFYNDQAISIEQLEKELVSWSTTAKVTLKIDAEAIFQSFVDLTDLLNKYDLKNVNIITLRRSTPAKT